MPAGVAALSRARAAAGLAPGSANMSTSVTYQQRRDAERSAGPRSVDDRRVLLGMKRPTTAAELRAPPPLQPDGTTAPSGTVADGVFVGGSGEPPSTSIGAVIANAFFAATDVRMRTAP